MSKYKIDNKKIMFNASIKSSIDFFPKQYELLKELNKVFPNWEVSGVGFTSRDTENHCSTTINHKIIIYEIENPEIGTDFSKDRITNILFAYNKFFPIKDFLRIGLRFFIFIPMIEIEKEELADIIQSKLFLNNDNISSILSDKLIDLTYIRDYKKDEFYYHFKCGPMPEEQISSWVIFGENRHRFKTPDDFKKYLDTFPKMSLFIDVDCYKKDISFTQMDSFLSKAFNNCTRIATDIKKYILGE